MMIWRYRLLEHEKQHKVTSRQTRVRRQNRVMQLWKTWRISWNEPFQRQLEKR